MHAFQKFTNAKQHAAASIATCRAVQAWGGFSTICAPWGDETSDGADGRMGNLRMSRLSASCTIVCFRIGLSNGRRDHVDPGGLVQESIVESKNDFGFF
jgi:hypothetical protein